VIGANAAHEIEIRIGSHKLIVVASDDNPIKPQEVDSLIVGGGERFDFYIRTKGAENANNYFITMRTLKTKAFHYDRLNIDNYGLAILKYEKVSSKTAICGDACETCGQDGVGSCVKVINNLYITIHTNYKQKQHQAFFHFIIFILTTKKS
jgi:hypothetical protein